MNVKPHLKQTETLCSSANSASVSVVVIQKPELPAVCQDGDGRLRPPRALRQLFRNLQVTSQTSRLLYSLIVPERNGRTQELICLVSNFDLQLVSVALVCNASWDM